MISQPIRLICHIYICKFQLDVFIFMEVRDCKTFAIRLQKLYHWTECSHFSQLLGAQLEAILLPLANEWRMQSESWMHFTCAHSPINVYTLYTYVWVYLRTMWATKLFNADHFSELPATTLARVRKRTNSSHAANERANERAALGRQAGRRARVVLFKFA